MSVLGYVVVEYNQVSHRPGLLMSADLHDERGDAEAEAARERARAAEVGRGERYAVARVVLDEEGSDAH